MLFSNIGIKIHFHSWHDVSAGNDDGCRRPWKRWIFLFSLFISSSIHINTQLYTMMAVVHGKVEYYIQIMLLPKAMLWLSEDHHGLSQLSWTIMDNHRLTWTIMIIRGLPHGGSACPKTGTRGSSGQGDLFRYTCSSRPYPLWVIKWAEWTSLFIQFNVFLSLTDSVHPIKILVKAVFDFPKLRWRQWVSVQAMPKHSLELKDFGVSL